MSAPDWPFDQGSRVAAATTRQVLTGGMPILRVTHYSDEHDWAFVCGTTTATEDLRLIAMEEAVKLDPTVRGVADLPPGWTAWREHVSGAWHRFLNEEA